MSANVHDLTGDKTMNETSCVRLANDDPWPMRSTAGTSTPIGDTGARETAYRCPHAPRTGQPKNVELTGLHFDISSTSELGSATHRSRISDCTRPSLRLLDVIRASYRRRIGYSRTDEFSLIHHSIWSRGGTAHPSHPLPASSVNPHRRRQLTPYRRPKPTQLRPKSRVNSAQTKSISGPIPRAVHRGDLTTLRLAPTTTHVPKQLTVTANDCRAHQISRIKS
jgi:hypothetical protein